MSKYGDKYYLLSDYLRTESDDKQIINKIQKFHETNRACANIIIDDLIHYLKDCFDKGGELIDEKFDDLEQRIENIKGIMFRGQDSDDKCYRISQLINNARQINSKQLNEFDFVRDCAENEGWCFYYDKQGGGLKPAQYQYKDDPDYKDFFKKAWKLFNVGKEIFQDEMREKRQKQGGNWLSWVWGGKKEDKMKKEHIKMTDVEFNAYLDKVWDHMDYDAKGVFAEKLKNSNLGAYNTQMKEYTTARKKIQREMSKPGLLDTPKQYSPNDIRKRATCLKYAKEAHNNKTDKTYLFQMTSNPNVKKTRCVKQEDVQDCIEYVHDKHRKNYPRKGNRKGMYTCFDNKGNVIDKETGKKTCEAQNDTYAQKNKYGVCFELLDKQCRNGRSWQVNGSVTNWMKFLMGFSPCKNTGEVVVGIARGAPDGKYDVCCAKTSQTRNDFHIVYFIQLLFYEYGADSWQTALEAWRGGDYIKLVTTILKALKDQTVLAFSAAWGAVFGAATGKTSMPLTSYTNNLDEYIKKMTHNDLIKQVGKAIIQNICIDAECELSHTKSQLADVQKALTDMTDDELQEKLLYAINNGGFVAIYTSSVNYWNIFYTVVFVIALGCFLYDFLLQDAEFSMKGVEYVCETLTGAVKAVYNWNYEGAAREVASDAAEKAKASLTLESKAAITQTSIIGDRRSWMSTTSEEKQGANATKELFVRIWNTVKGDQSEIDKQADDALIAETQQKTQQLTKGMAVTRQQIKENTVDFRMNVILEDDFEDFKQYFGQMRLSFNFIYWVLGLGAASLTLNSLVWAIAKLRTGKGVNDNRLVNNFAEVANRINATKGEQIEKANKQMLKSITSRVKYFVTSQRLKARANRFRRYYNREGYKHQGQFKPPKEIVERYRQAAVSIVGQQPPRGSTAQGHRSDRTV